MRKLKRKLNAIALFMAGLILLQSCSVYKSPVNLEQAAQEEQAVKIITVEDETYKYKYIVYEEGQFYGVKDNPGDDVKFPINTEEVADVLMKKGGMPWWAWSLMVLGGIFVILIIAYAADPNPGIDLSGEIKD